jgi:phage terminase large subunit GpA-like protein
MTAQELFTESELAEQSAWLDDIVDEIIHTETNHLTVSEWAERKRVIPKGLSPIWGPFSWEVTPYLREIVDCLSATSPVQEVVVMKGAQIGFTVGVLENWIGYVIDCEPGPMMFVSGDKEMAEAAIELRVDRMIDSAGIADKIFSQSEKEGNRGTGNTKKKKEFAGGFLLPVGPNSATKLRQFSVQYEALDEVEAYPASAEDEGDPLKLLRARTYSFTETRKILYGSTPAIKQTSKIEPLFLEGDQRRYYVPCKHCKEMQYLEWSQMHYEKNEDGKLLYDYNEKGEAIKGTGHVWYECKKCHGHWTNNDKMFFLPRGEWRPTAKPKRPGLRSYHVPGMLSPVGFYSWENAIEDWINAQGNPLDLKAFVNTFFGETFEIRGEAPPVDRVMLRRDPAYFPETLTISDDGERVWTEARVPKGPLIVTLGADVQHDRIECELVAWGPGKESWSIGYHVLPGDTSDPNGPPWQALTEILHRPLHGVLKLVLALIDSSDQAPVVYTYCDRFMSGVLPIKGSSNTLTGRRIFAIRDVAGHQCKRIDLDEGQLKQEFYAQTKIGPLDVPEAGAELPPGYCHFPHDETYDRRYFEKLYSEDHIPETDRYGRTRYKWVKHGRNEALDARAYALGALYVIASLITCGDNDPDGTVDWDQFWEALKESA